MHSPRFIISKKKVLEQFRVVEGMADVVSYSSKTNPIVAGILEDNTDCMFSVHLPNELKNIRDKSRVLFLAQAWNKGNIKELVDSGVSNFVVDNESDLDILLDFLEENDSKINLMLRLRLKENTIKTEKYFVFGMRAEVINRRLREINNNQALRSKIGGLGVHFHRKTQNMAEWNLAYEISNILEPDVLEIIDMINIGGGLPSRYANVNFDVLASIIRKIGEFKAYLDSFGIKLMMEPGRFIAAPAGKLVTKIVGIHENTIIINASVYNTDLDALIVPVKLCVEGELSRDDTGAEAYAIKGITPCSLDLFRYRVYLKSPEVGEEVVFENAGAYNFSSDFCELGKVETIIVD